MLEVDESWAKATTLKAIKDFLAFNEFLIEKAIAANKAMEDFRASSMFKNEKVDFVVVPYKKVIRMAKDNVVTRFLRLDLSFLDELPIPEGDKVMTDTFMDASTPTIAL